MDMPSIRDITTDALGYWERRRPLYNIVLAAVVIGYFVAGLPKTMAAITVDGALGLFALAVFANVVYCAAYTADVFAQLSGFRDEWRRYRWVLLFVGCALGAVITRTIVTSALAGV
jgi:hypothetical protein